MRNISRATIGIFIIIFAALALQPRVAAEPGIGSDAVFPVIGVASDTVLEPAAGAPVLGPVPPPPAAVIASLTSPPLPPGAGEVQDISYGDENAVMAPLSIEFSVGPGFGGVPSIGHPAAPAPPPPAFDVRMEAGVFPPAPFGDGMTASDVYMNYPAPLMGAPPCGVGSNRQILDGDGAPGAPFGPPRLGLGMPEPGSNVDAYDRSDQAMVDTAPPPAVPDLPVFFTIDMPTAIAWPVPIPAPGGPALPGPGDVLAWNPVIGGPVIYATAAGLGLVPGDDVDALAVNLPAGVMLPPLGLGWDFAPAGHIVFSLAAGSPSLAPTSGGIGAVPLTPACFGPGMATAADLFIVFVPAAPGGAPPYIGAEQLGLGAVRSGAPTDDELDAVDICNGFAGSDIDADMIDAACDPDMDGDGVGNGIDPDADGDGFADVPPTAHQGPANTNALVDNCIGVWNPAQLNADGNFVDMSPPKGYDDLTWARSDAQGDDCDTDDDNDGLLDTTETAGPPCASATGATNPLVRDTDGDRVLDGAECTNGTNPNLATSFPPGAVCQSSGDTDADGVLDSRERCYYNSLTTSVNSDGDTLDDGCEIASVNADLTVNVIDLQQIAQSVPPAGTAGYLVNLDVNKDGAINVLDLQFVAARSIPCP